MLSHDSAILELYSRIERSAGAILRPPARMSVPDWADTNRHLAASAGAVAGPWSTERVEVARGPMMAITEPGVRTITYMVCTQTLKTSAIENAIGYFAHLDPCPMLLVEPKDEMVESFSKERLVPLAAASPILRGLFAERRSRNTDNTLRFKSFPGGFLALASAGSPTNLAMRAIRLVFMDEIDKFVTSNEEGDPIKLAEERMATFRDAARSIRACSPTLEATSRIYASYVSSDQRQPFAQCPHCGEWVTLDFFRDVHWEKTESGVHVPETARLLCPKCSEEITEAQRMHFCTTRHAIRHQQTKKFQCCGEEQSPLDSGLWEWDEENQVGYALCKHCGKRAVSNRHAGFTASKLFSPFSSIVDLAVNWIEVKDDPEQKQTFVNTQLGKPYREKSMANTTVGALLSRRELYAAEVPAGAVVLTAGIDVQDGGSANIGRFEVEIVGWGVDEESWSIETHIIHGDPAGNEVWNDLEAILVKPFKHELGFELRLMAACMDSGGYSTQRTYDFCRKRTGRNIWAIKGASDRQAQWSPIWPQAERHEVYRTGHKPVIIGVNSAKEAVRSALFVSKPGPNYCHFPEVRDKGWFEQLVESEHIVLERSNGVTIRRWQKKPGRRNEALDCRVYALAALKGLYQARKLNLATARAMQEEIAARIKEDGKKLVDKIATVRHTSHSSFMDRG